MQTIVVKLYPEKLQNADLDLRYSIPDRIAEVTHGAVQDNGYDYLENNALGLWLMAESAQDSIPVLVQLFQEETFKSNDLSLTAELYISEQDSDELENCRLVFPQSVISMEKDNQK